MFLLCGTSYMVTSIFCHSFRLLYHILLWSCYPYDLTLLFSSLSLTIQLKTNICQVINYNFIKTIKSTPTSEKVIHFVINQVYQIRRNIWQDVNYNVIESRQSKLGEIWFSLVLFRLVHCSVQVPIWWWSKFWLCLIGKKGLCIGFS